MSSGELPASAALACERDEAHGKDRRHLDALGSAPVDLEVLIRFADRDDEAAALPELREQRGGHSGRGGCDHDRVKRRRVGPTPVAVAMAHVYRSIAESAQGILGAARERLEDLD